MAAEEKWYFTKEQLANTPSRRFGFDTDRELSYRQQAANFIQDMGQRLQVTQLCINTAIVYMHRFYVYHSFTHFHRNAIATAALFLAAKVEEQPRKLEHVIKVAHVCLHREAVNLDPKSDNTDPTKEKPKRIHFPTFIASVPLPESYLEQAQDLVFNENVLLQTLSFDVAIDHPHTHVVRCCHMVKASKDLAQTSYFMASNSLHLTTMCLQYKPTVVACFCIHLACKWSNWEIPQSNEGKDWFSYVDKTVTFDQLEQLTTEFLQIFDKCPTKLKRKIMSITATQNAILPAQAPGGSQLFDNEPRKIPETQHSRHPLLPAPGSPLDSAPPRKSSSGGGQKQPPPSPAPGPPKVAHTYDQYREKKEKERLEREGKQQQQQQQQPPTKEHGRENHHVKPTQHASKSHPPGSAPPLAAPVRPSPSETKPAPPPASSSSASSALYNPHRPPVSASRDQLRRDQAHAREMSKQHMLQQQQPSIFSPQPATHAAPPADALAEALTSAAGSSNKNSSQEWQQDKSSHSNELETNRHNSDKYNNIVKDSNRIVDTTQKRPHSKDHRQQPAGESLPKLSLEESQRLYSSKYGQRKGEGEAKEGERYEGMKRPHEPDRHESLKRPSFGPTVPPPHALKQRSDFSVSNHKKEESSGRSVASSGKPVPLSGHHASAKPPHRVPPAANHRVPSPALPCAGGGRVPTHPSHSQSRSASARVPPSPVVAAGRVATPTSSLQRPPHRGPSPFPPALQQRPRSPRMQPLKPADNAAPDGKPHNAVHQTPPAVKSESRNGSMHPTEDVKRLPRDVFRPEFVKTEPGFVKAEPGLVKTEPGTQRSLPDLGRGFSDAFRTDSQKSDDQRLISEPLVIKVERDELGTSTLSTTPKSSVNNSRSATSSLTPNSNSGRESSHTHRTPTKPSSRHHTPPSANRRALPELSVAPVGPMSPPEFGSPLLPLPTTPGKQHPPLTPGSSNSSSRSQHRNRTTSSSSEPELIPYMKKIEEIAGFENILESKKGIKLLDKLPQPGRVPDMIQPIRDRVKEEPTTSTTIRPITNSISRELKPPDLIRPFPLGHLDSLPQINSCELGAVAFPAVEQDLNGVVKTEAGTSRGPVAVVATEPEHIKAIIEPSKLLNIPSALSSLEGATPGKSENRHKREKKNKKEKHKHKEKDKDNPERKKKRKHKEKDKHRDREDRELAHGSAPIKITIPKEKILSSTIDTNATQPQGLKIKILKDRLKVSEVSTPLATGSSMSTPVAGSGGLKLKISKDIIETYTTPMSTKESRKRDRTLLKTTPDESRPAKTARVETSKRPPAPPVAAVTSSYAKPNGVRSSLHSKVDLAGGVSGHRGSSSGSKPSH